MKIVKWTPDQLLKPGQIIKPYDIDFLTLEAGYLPQGRNNIVESVGIIVEWAPAGFLVDLLAPK
jgi:hypothetical protein